MFWELFISNIWVSKVCLQYPKIVWCISLMNTCELWTNQSTRDIKWSNLQNKLLKRRKLKTSTKCLASLCTDPSYLPILHPTTTTTTTTTYYCRLLHNILPFFLKFPSSYFTSNIQYLISNKVHIFSSSIMTKKNYSLSSDSDSVVCSSMMCIFEGKDALAGIELHWIDKRTITLSTHWLLFEH